MMRIRPMMLALLLLAIGGLTAATLADDKKAEEPKTLAQSILDEGAQEFSRKNAKVMARFFTEDADLRLVTRDGEQLKVEAHHGRAEIEEFYKRLFDNGDNITAKNTVEHAKLIAHDVLFITGVFQPDTSKDLKVEFIQVRRKVGKDWLIHDLQVYFVPKSE